MQDKLKSRLLSNRIEKIGSGHVHWETVVTPIRLLKEVNMPAQIASLQTFGHQGLYLTSTVTDHCILTGLGPDPIFLRGHRAHAKHLLQSGYKTSCRVELKRHYCCGMDSLLPPLHSNTL